MNSSYFSIEDPATFDIEEEKRLEETALDTNKKHKSAEDIMSIYSQPIQDKKNNMMDLGNGGRIWGNCGHNFHYGSPNSE